MGQMLLLHILLLLLSWMHDGFLDNHPYHPPVVCPSTNNLHETISKYNKETQPSTVSCERTGELHHMALYAMSPLFLLRLWLLGIMGNKHITVVLFNWNNPTHTTYVSIECIFPLLSSLCCSRR